MLIRFVTMNARSPDANERLTRAIHSLQGLSCGDAFGERFFVHPDVAHSLITQRAVPSAPWRYTDDTAMAVAIAETLEEFGEINPERLAENFGRRFIADPHRGYRPAMHSLPLNWPIIRNTGENWRHSYLRGAVPLAMVPQCALLPSVPSLLMTLTH